MAQWLECYTSIAEGAGSVPGQEVRFCKLHGTVKK